MDCTAITFEVHDHVATITLDRTDALNSFDDAMGRDMAWAWTTVRDTDDIHAVVLKGAYLDRAALDGMLRDVRRAVE